MPSLEFFIVSESASVDSDTNRISLFNVLEEISTTVFPFTFPGFVSVSSWNLDPADVGKDFQVTLRVTLPNGEEKEFPTNFTPAVGARRQRITHRFINIPIQQEGYLRFEVHLNGQYTASHTCSVRLPNAEEQARIDNIQAAN